MPSRFPRIKTTANEHPDDRSITAKLRRRTDNSHFSSIVIALINRDANISCLIRQFSRNGTRDCRLNFMHRAREAREHNKITSPRASRSRENNLKRAFILRRRESIPKSFISENYFSHLIHARARTFIRNLLLPSLESLSAPCRTDLILTLVHSR